MREEKVVFLDRDGVINVDPIGDYIKSWEDFHFEKGVIETLKEISKRGYKMIIISNQAGIGDGVYPESALWDIQKNMLSEFEKDGIKIHASYYCLHGKTAGCSCRKPETGLFEQAAEKIKFDKSKTFYLGDKATDMEAAQRFGLRSIFIRTGHGRFDEAKLGRTIQPDYRIDEIKEVLEILK
jgi:D-glycero-D-manno-heptose 1,7-bisphosphate phosphatase